MSYCVNCGVELAPTADICPLCQTPVVNPRQAVDRESPPFFPTRPAEVAPVSKRELAVLLTTMLASLSLCCAVLNLFLHPEIAWALFAVGASAMLWVWFVLPLLLRRAPVWARLTLDMCAVGLYVYLISLALDGSSWFHGLALPILLLATVVVLVLGFLLRGGRRSTLTTLVFCLVAVALLTVGVELFSDLFFEDAWTPGWSLVVLASCLGLCLPLIVVRRVPSLREEVRRRFHF